MTDEQASQIADAILRTVHGPLNGPAAQPMGMEAVTLALAGGFKGTGEDSVAAGLHDIASAIRELAEAVSANAAGQTPAARKDG